MKKGFTTMELLAVIIVLALLSLIAIPQMVGIINSSKEGGSLESAKNYIRALEDQMIADQFDRPVLKSGTYEVIDGVIIKPGNYANPEDGEFKPDSKGDMPEYGWVKVKSGEVLEAEFKFDKYIIEYDGKDVSVNKEKEEVSEYVEDEETTKDENIEG